MKFQAGDRVKIVRLGNLTESAHHPTQTGLVKIGTEIQIEKIVDSHSYGMVALFKPFSNSSIQLLIKGLGNSCFDGLNGVRCEDIQLASEGKQKMTRQGKERLISVAACVATIALFSLTFLWLIQEDLKKKYPAFKISPDGTFAVMNEGELVPLTQLSRQLLVAANEDEKPAEPVPARIGDGIRNFRDTTEELDKAAQKLNALLDRLNGGLDRIGTKGIVIKIEIPDGAADTN